MAFVETFTEATKLCIIYLNLCVSCCRNGCFHSVQSVLPLQSARARGDEVLCSCMAEGKLRRSSSGTWQWSEMAGKGMKEDNNVQNQYFSLIRFTWLMLKVWMNVTGWLMLKGVLWLSLLSVLIFIYAVRTPFSACSLNKSLCQLFCLCAIFLLRFLHLACEWKYKMELNINSNACC